MDSIQNIPFSTWSGICWPSEYMALFSSSKSIVPLLSTSTILHIAFYKNHISNWPGNLVRILTIWLLQNATLKATLICISWSLSSTSFLNETYGIFTIFEDLKVRLKWNSLVSTKELWTEVKLSIIIHLALCFTLGSIKLSDKRFQ